MYTPQFRRRRAAKTDYSARLKLIKAGRLRLVIRPSLSHIVLQFIAYKPTGDATLASASSAELRRYGWLAPTGNLPAAYLTGLLAGLRATAAGITACVLDIGLQTSTPGSRLYAALKGVLDAGIAVPHAAHVLPAAERLVGRHIVAWAAAAPKPAFSAFGIKPSNLEQHFADVKQKIIATKGANYD